MTTTEPATATQVYQLYIKAAAEQIWDAITNPETVAKFFHGAQVDSTYQVGTKIRSLSPDGSQVGTCLSSRPHLPLPLAPVDDLLERAPVRLLQRRQRPVGRVAEGHHAGALPVLGQPEDPPRPGLIAHRGVPAADT
jgi:hypothetical protein